MTTSQSPSAQMNALIEAFIAVQDPEGMREFWRGVPTELEQPLIEAVEALIQQAQAAGNTRAVEDLRARLADFKRLREEAQLERKAPPLVRALRAFVFAQDEAAARSVFEQQRTVLQPYEAQRLLEAQQADDPAAQQHLAERIALLRRLRGAQPEAAPSVSEDLQDRVDTRGLAGGTTFDNRQMQIGGSLYQAQEINITNVFDLEWRWVRPEPPDLPKALVERAADIEAVIEKIRAQGVVAISGVKGASAPAALTMQGMAGVGKTSLAHLVAQRLDADYADGVLWTDVGPGV